MSYLSANQSRSLRIFIASLVAAFGLGCYCLFVGFSIRPQGVDHVRQALGQLAMIQCALAEEDLDGDGIPNYWRADVKGIFKFGPSSRLHPLPYRPEVAQADVTAGGPAKPFHGYFFRQIRFHAEKDLADRRRFAICAFPADAGEAWGLVYIMMHDLSDATYKDQGPSGERTLIKNMVEYGKSMGKQSAASLEEVPEGLDGHREVAGWTLGGGWYPPRIVPR